MLHQLMKRLSGFTLIELLVVISIIAILASLALPAITGAIVRGQMTQTLSNMKQLHLATQQAALDAVTTGDSTLVGWPDTNSFAVWATNMVPSYLSTNDMVKLLSAAGMLTAPGAVPTANTNAVIVYTVSEQSTGDTIFLTTANWTNDSQLSPTAKPYGNKGFVIFHKAGDGAVLLPKQYNSSNVLGVSTNSKLS